MEGGKVREMNGRLVNIFYYLSIYVHIEMYVHIYDISIHTRMPVQLCPRELHVRLMEMFDAGIYVCLSILKREWFISIHYASYLYTEPKIVYDFIYIGIYAIFYVI